MTAHMFNPDYPSGHKLHYRGAPIGRAR
jgi:hypothetical protein